MVHHLTSITTSLLVDSLTVKIVGKYTSVMDGMGIRWFDRKPKIIETAPPG